jgi:hypothetical protein
LAGIGSLGMDSFCAWIQDKAADVERIIDMIEEDKPASYYYMGHISQGLYHLQTEDKDAKAVVIADRKVSVHPDPFAGWLQLGKKQIQQWNAVLGKVRIQCLWRRRRDDQKVGT